MALIGCWWGPHIRSRSARRPPRRPKARSRGRCAPATAASVDRAPTTQASRPSGHKRYEVRLKSAQQLWATVGANHLYKNAEAPEACFYVDLPTGDTPVELRASDPNGVSAEWMISELGSKAKSWYDTFRFECGNPGVCSFDEIDSRKAELSNMTRGLLDPCGSTKLEGDDLGYRQGARQPAPERAARAAHARRLQVRCPRRRTATHVRQRPTGRRPESAEPPANQSVVRGDARGNRRSTAPAARGATASIAKPSVVTVSRASTRFNAGPDTATRYACRRARRRSARSSRDRATQMAVFEYPDSYDVIVVGAGHAGCEASLAAARMGARVLVLTG